MAKVIMIQGTTSNAGKSFLTAALCRIFKQDGYSVAPFKSQNMALNSYITQDGLEMGRAQVMQAEAAGIAPSVQMNPILLKPTSDTGSQVIVNGVPLGTMPAKEYFRRKQAFVPDILEAYHTLAQKHDIIVIEGAGSPAEINLKQNDIVNMGLAQLVDAPVLLCGDIDRGGVFASLYGTVALLEPQEQARIKGLVINNFRGDKTILDPGTEMLEKLTGKPVVGVIPHLDVNLDDEDSLSSRFDRTLAPAALDIAVIRLPRISNFTDFNALERMEQVSLRYVHITAQLGNPDVVILPGTKNTIQDLLWLRQQGLEAAILKYASNGGSVVGICGGYQMMGRTLSDPEGWEGGGTVSGLGLLDGDTLFAPEKARTQVTGQVTGAQGIFTALNGTAFSGYEIHMGRTSGTCPFAQLQNQTEEISSDGSVRGNCWGSYVHGIFDQGSFAQQFVSCLLHAKGLGDCPPVQDWKDYKEQQYDRLADGVRQSIDLPAIYRILEGNG
jgi:adenosylcobyric acid synthase